MGAELFVRTNRSVALTPAGTAFLATARAVLSTLDEGVDHARRVGQGIDGHLVLTFINIAPYGALLRALRRFQTTFPAIAFTMREATTQEQVDALARGQADVGFLRPPGMPAPGLSFETILREPVVVALPATHRLARRRVVPLADLADDDFVSSPRHLGQGFHDQLVRLCQAAGFVPRVAQQARQLQTLVALVAGGFGVALLPASLAHTGIDDVVFRRLRVAAPPDWQSVDLQMAWNPAHPGAARDRLLQEVRASLSTSLSNETSRISIPP